MTPQKDWTPPRAPDCTASSGKSARDAQSSRQDARPPDCTPTATASFCSTGAVTAEKDAAALRRDAAPAGLVLHLTAKGDPEGVAEALRGIAGVQEAVGTEEQPGVATVTVRLSPEMSGANRDVRDEIFFTMAEKRYTLLSMEAEEQSAEELFASLTKEGEA